MRPQEPKRAKILVIDDAIDIHRLLRIRLRDQNVDIISATSGGEGLLLAADEKPDLILLDIDMPEMDGFETLQALKHYIKTVEIPVIFLSGTEDSSNKVRGFDLGAVDFITKPFDLAELRARVRSALRTQRLLTLLSQRAQVDGLTGIWNRVHLDERLAEFSATALRHRQPLSLILCDIDQFKSINDTYGHPYGDVVLQEFAHLLLAKSRESDIPCRYGGEEFAIILPNLELAGAYTAAERYRAACERLTWPEHDELTVTVSIGVTELDLLVDRTPAGMIASADEALYLAKDQGRNRCVCAERQSPPRKFNDDRHDRKTA